MSTPLQEHAYAAGCDALPQATDHPTRDQNILHVLQTCLYFIYFSSQQGFCKPQASRLKNPAGRFVGPELWLPGSQRRHWK